MAIAIRNMVGPGYRLAKPINPLQVRDVHTKLRESKSVLAALQSLGVPVSKSFKPFFEGDNKLVLFSPKEYKLESKNRLSKLAEKIKVSVYFPENSDEESYIVRIRTDFARSLRGSALMSIQTPQFLEDAATIRRYVLAVAKALMAGAEAFLNDRFKSQFWFIFSADDPETNYVWYLERRPNMLRKIYQRNLSLIFYPDIVNEDLREINVTNFWIIYQLLEQDLSSIDLSQFAYEAGTSEQGIKQRLIQINKDRGGWGLPPLLLDAREISFSEIKTAVKELRQEHNIWPTLRMVAEKLETDVETLQAMLEYHNQTRIPANRPPLYLA